MVLFWIKFVHSIVFVVESSAILYILYCALFDVQSPLLGVAIGLVLAEIGVYLANGARCPLTKLARRLGDRTGNDFIADIFLPQRAARLIPAVCGTLAVAGLLVLGLRWATALLA